MEIDPQLIDKYFLGTATREETRQVLDWFDTTEGEQFLLDRMKEGQSSYTQTDGEPDELDPQQALDEIEEQITFHTSGRKKNHRSGTRAGIWAVAASLLLIVSVIFVFDLFNVPSRDSKILRYATQANEHKTLVLQDGTKIRMNEQTSIKISQPFGIDKRTIKLEGEAFFKVTEDPARPFIVQTGTVRVKVLGTVFNVKASDSTANIQVAVAEGVVKMQARQVSQTEVVLKKNTIGVYSSQTQSIQKYEGAVTNYMSWMTGRLVFNRTPFVKVIRQLEWIYGIDCTLHDKALQKLQLTADFSATSLQQVLKTIAYSLGINYQKEGTHIIWTSDQSVTCNLKQ